MTDIEKLRAALGNVMETLEQELEQVSPRGFYLSDNAVNVLEHAERILEITAKR